MDENSKIPQSTDTGSSGTQETSLETLVPANNPPFGNLNITETIQGLAATKSRSMGGDVVAALIAGATTQMSYELAGIKKELAEERKKSGEIATEHSRLSVRNAVLQERINSEGNTKHLRNISIVIGTTLISIGIEFSRNNFDKISYLMYGLGGALLFLGWLSGTKRESQ